MIDYQIKFEGEMFASDLKNRIGFSSLENNSYNLILEPGLDENDIYHNLQNIKKMIIKNFREDYEEMVLEKSELDTNSKENIASAIYLATYYHRKHKYSFQDDPNFKNFLSAIEDQEN
jgi:hypothetical protein